jgi:hypothetical protein
VTAVVAAASLVMGGLALADQVNVDNDLVSPGNQNTVSITTTAGATVNTSMQIAVSYGGSKHLTKNQDLTFTNDSSATNLPAGYTAPDITVTIGSTWTTNSIAANSGTLSFTAPAAGSYTYTVQYNEPASESCASSPCLGGSATETINLTVNPASVSCDTTTPGAPVVTAVASPDATTGWYNATSNTAGFTLAPATDAEYSLDNGTTWSAYTGEVDFTTDGQYSVIARNFRPATGSCARVDGTSSSPVAFDVDRHAPVITDEGFASGTAGSNGWYTSPVTESFAASDATSGLADCSATFSKTSGATEEGSSVTVSSGPCSDLAGNTNNGIDSGSYKIDLVNPSLNITDPNAVTSFDVCTDGTPERPSFAPSDTTTGSGIDTDPTKTYDSWTPSSLASGVGSYSYYAQAYDLAGRNTNQTLSYNVTYGSAFSGYLQPINADGSSRFKLGSTIPVKFRLSCNGVSISTAVAKLYVKQGDGAPDPGTDEAISTAASTTGNLFRYDATAGQYIFNLSTKQGYTNPGSTTATAFTSGTWTLKILLDDGTFKSINIQLVR